MHSSVVGGLIEQSTFSGPNNVVCVFFGGVTQFSAIKLVDLAQHCCRNILPGMQTLSDWVAQHHGNGPIVQKTAATEHFFSLVASAGCSETIVKLAAAAAAGTDSVSC